MPIHKNLPVFLGAWLLSAVPLDGLALDNLLIDQPQLPDILTASRLRQSAAEVPGSMTLIDRELIRASGARDIPEILRLVPGMMVGQRRGNQFNVNYHGTSITEARRLQVLIDGRSVYRPGLATVDWAEIPLAIEDIDHIEVFRGPNTAAYGANAFLGVVNIVTRHPREDIGTRLKVVKGKRGVNDWYASQSFSTANSQTRLSLSGIEDDGFDTFGSTLGFRQFEPDQDYRDGRRGSRFNLRSAIQLNASQSIDWQVAASEMTRQSYYDYEPFLQPVTPALGGYDSNITQYAPKSDYRNRDYAVQLRWNNDLSSDHNLQVLAYAQHMERLRDWRVCDSPLVFSPELQQLAGMTSLGARRVSRWLRTPRIWNGLTLPEYMEGSMRGTYLPEHGELALQVEQQRLALLDSEMACWDINQNLRESRYHLEVQDTLRISEQLRMVNGASVREDRVNSQTYFGGVLNNRIYQLFSNIEYRPHQRLLLQAGGMYEDDRRIGDSFSPRLASHLFLAPQHSLRLVYSEAVRSPDMFENNATWSYPVKNLSGPVSGPQQYYITATGPGNLGQEQMRSRELGYNGHFAEQGLSIDIRYFREQLRDLNSQPLKIEDFLPDNESEANFRGFESQIDWRVTRNDRLRLTHARIRFDATASMDQRLTPKHSGSAAWLRQWPANWHTSLIYHGADKLNERRFERVDARIEKRMQVTPASQLTLALNWQQRLDKQGMTWRENLYDSPRQYYLSAELDF